MSASQAPVEVLLTADQIRERRARYDNLRQQIEMIERERAQLREWLENVAKILGKDVVENLIGPFEGKEDQKNGAIRTRRGGITWASFIEDYASSVNRPVEYREIKNAILESVLAPKLQQSDKSFYSAVLKLIDQKRLIRCGGHVMTPGAFENYEQRVKAGEIQPLPESGPKKLSPMAQAIERYLSDTNEGVESSAIVRHIREIERFRPVVEKNATNVYNVLARMVRRNELIKRGSLYFIQSSANENSGSN